MNLKKLLDEEKIEKIEKLMPDFKKCEKDLDSSKHSLQSKDYEWAETIAYNSVLRAGIKLMEFMGYRPAGKEHHKNVFIFLKEIEINPDLVTFFNKIRVKRNEFIYRDGSDVSEKEAEEIIRKAEEFVHKIRTFVHKIRTEEAKNEPSLKNNFI